MALYAGEPVRITTTAKNFNLAQLNNTQVNSVVIEIHDPNSVVVVAETAMLWSSTESLWYYIWNTATLAPGTYRAKISIIGIDNSRAFEFQRIRLARPLF